MTLIAILDDRVTNRQIFSKLAASLEAGIAVEAFGDPLAALDWLDANPPDLVVADYKMPHINGAEFTRRLRQRAYGLDVPVIIVTAYDDREDKLRALEAGATDFLQTPVDHQEFISRARNLLLLRRHQQVAKTRAIWLERALATNEEIRRDLGRELLRSDRALLSDMLDAVPALISATDPEGHLIFLNAAGAEAFGAARFGDRARAADGSAAGDDLLGQVVYSAMDPARADRHREWDRRVLSNGETISGVEEAVVDADGVSHRWLTSKTLVRSVTGQTATVLTTSVKLAECPNQAGSDSHASHEPDGETDGRPTRQERARGQPSLEALRDLISERINAANGTAFAVHLIGFDNFKAINKAYGLDGADAVLAAAWSRLRQLARPEDIVARARGDAFVLVQSREPDEIAATALADRIRRALATPFAVGGSEVPVTVSIGISLYPTHGLTASDLLRGAQRAMQDAKAKGRNAARLFSRSLGGLLSPSLTGPPGPGQGSLPLDPERRDPPSIPS